MIIIPLLLPVASLIQAPRVARLNAADCMHHFEIGAKQAALHDSNFMKFVGRWEKPLGIVRAPSSWGWLPPSAVIFTPASYWEATGFQAGRRYQAEDQYKAQAQAFGNQPQYLVATVFLYAWPGIRGLHHISRPAVEADVKDVTFALLPDGDAEKAILPASQPVQYSSSDIEGAVATTEPNAASFFSSGYGPAGYYSGRSTVFYSQVLTQGYNAYQATYMVFFPIVNKDGSWLIRASTKTLVLKVVYPSGEHSATFKISDFPSSNEPGAGPQLSPLRSISARPTARPTIANPSSPMEAESGFSWSRAHSPFWCRSLPRAKFPSALETKVSRPSAGFSVSSTNTY